MEQMKKPSALSAGSASLGVLVFVMIFAENTKKTSDLDEILLSLCILTLAISAIRAWVKYLKDYVNFTVEEKLQS